MYTTNELKCGAGLIGSRVVNSLTAEIAEALLSEFATYARENDYVEKLKIQAY
jgi:hypothetical protein